MPEPPESPSAIDKHRELPDRALERELTDLLLRQAVAPLVVSLLAMLLVSWLLWSVVDRQWLQAWLVVGVAVTAARGLLLAHLRRRRRDGETPSRLPISVVALLGGQHWGAMAFFWSPELPLHAQLTLVLVPVALASTAIISYGPSLSAYLSFAVSATAPLAVGFLVSPDPSMQGLSFGCLLIVLGLSAVGKGWNRQIRSMVALRLRNERLIADLEHQNQELVQARDAAEAANRERERFLTRMSHEFRTPMNGVLGMAQVLERSTLDHAQQEALATLKSSGGDMLRLINDLLDIAGIAGNTDLGVQRAEFAVRPALQACLGKYELAARAKSLGWRVDFAEGLPARLLGDPDRLTRVLDILLDNAVKFTGHGGITVTLDWSGDAQVLGLEVRDTGEGFDNAQRHRLFQRFSQLDGSSTRSHDGTGNGLYLAGQIVHALGGEIDADGVPGQGARFGVRLPMAAAPDGPIEARVLVAEDNPVNQAVVEAMLEDMGCSVVIVEDGAQVMDALRAERFDMVFMDCQMPVMDGLEATRNCRRLGLSLPIVALTAHAAEHDRLACLQAGMNDFLSKPYSVAALRGMVQSWAGGSLLHAA